VPRENAVNAEILSIAAQLDQILDDLGESVAALTAILQRAAPPPPDEEDERLVTP
jgi:hypothetical protein